MKQLKRYAISATFATLFFSCADRSSGPWVVNPLCILYSDEYANELVGEIVFGNNFNSDTVTFSINHVPVFADQVITTHKETGLSGEYINIYSLDGDLELYYEEKIQPLLFTPDSLSLFNLTLNGKNNHFIVDLTKGKYFGLYQDENMQVSLKQSHTYFSFD